MTDEVMTQFKTEGQKPFENADKENANSSESSTGEKTNNDTTGSSDQDKNQTETKGADGTTEEGKENLADHPRWKERENDWTKRFNDQEQRHVQEIGKLREEFLGKGKDTTSSNSESADAPLEIPSWFGGDEEQFKNFLAWNEKQVIAKAKELAVKDIDSRTEAEQKKLDDATSYMNEQITSIETDKALNPEGLSIDKNKLLKVVLDNDLVDTKGRWNYKAAFKIMKPGDVFKAKSAMTEKRAVASATTSENRAEAKPKAFMTSDDFKKPNARPW